MGALAKSLDFECEYIFAANDNASPSRLCVTNNFQHTGGTKTRYVTSATEEIADLDGNRVVLRRYIAGPAIDERVAQVDANGAVTYIHTDKQNSVVALTNSSGAAISRRGYGTYGETNSAQMAETTHPFGYTGRRWESELGLYYYRARWYDPELGTFLQTDPIGSLDYINLYSYVGLNPMNATDPTGMSCIANPDLKGVTCKIDDPGELKGKVLDKANADYTRATNRLLSHPNKTVTISATNRSGKIVTQSVSAGSVAKSLISAKISYAGQSTSYNDHGKNLVNTAQTEVKDGVASIALYSGALSNLGLILTHEGIHGTNEGISLQRQSNSGSSLLGLFRGAKGFNISHQNSFNRAAAELQEPNQ